MRISSMMSELIISRVISRNEVEMYNAIMANYFFRNFSKSSKGSSRNNPELATIYADIEAARKRYRRQDDVYVKKNIRRDIKKMSRDYEWMMNFRNKLMCISVD